MLNVVSRVEKQEEEEKLKTTHCLCELCVGYQITIKNPLMHSFENISKYYYQCAKNEILY